jgi:pilus assembly protein Flp/PilA
MRISFTRFARNESGVTTIEYALILGLIVIGIVASVSLIGTTVNKNYYRQAAAGFK